jgi:hypothetical protein
VIKTSLCIDDGAVKEVDSVLAGRRVHEQVNKLKNLWPHLEARMKQVLNLCLINGRCFAPRANVRQAHRIDDHLESEPKKSVVPNMDDRGAIIGDVLSRV